MAARTYGFITIGNIVTLIGFALVVIGVVLVVDARYLAGFLIIGAGRLCDLLDGWLADITKTKSYVGASFDVFADKFASLLALLALPSSSLMPWWPAIGIIIVQTVTGIASTLVVRQKIPIFPVKSGKIGMAVIWAGILGYVVGAMFDGESGGVIRFLATCIAVVGVSFSGHAMLQYCRQYVATQRKS